MKKIFECICMAAIMLCGCSAPQHDETSAGGQSVYNQYLRTSRIALTDRNAVMVDGNHLYYADYEPLTAPDYLCFDPSCNHRSSECASNFSGAAMVFGSEDYLYYPAMDDNAYAFYRMTYQGTEREKLFDFPYNESSDIGYSVDYNDPYVCVLLNAKELNDGRGSVLIKNINNKNDDWECIFGDNSDRDYKSVIFHDGWYFSAYRIGEGKLGLEAYRLSDGTRIDVTDDWDLLSASDIAVTEDHFVWTKQEDGFYSKGFADQEPEKIASLEKVIDQAQTFADDEFFCLINTSVYVDDQLDIPEEERGLKIYDRSGNLLVKLSNQELGFHPLYLWSEKNRIVFANSDQSFIFPYFYIYKEDIRNKKPEYHLIS